MLMATIHREMGHGEKHAALIREIEPRWRRTFPDEHVVIGALLAEQALGTQARGEPAQALTLMDKALGFAEGSAASGGPADLVPIVLMNRSAILLDLGRAAEAADDAQRAVLLFTEEAGSGVSTSYLGRSYLALGRARSAEGRRAEALAGLRSAVHHLDSAVGSNHPVTQGARQFLDAEL